MASRWHADTKAAIRARGRLFTFIDILVATPIYLSSYEADIDIGGKLYVSGLLETVEPPPQSGEVAQDVQTFTVGESLNGFTSQDFRSQLGDYHGAEVIIQTLVEDPVTRLLLTDPDKVVYRTDGIIKRTPRPERQPIVMVEITNSIGKLDQVKELRTTRGSMYRRDKTDTSFDRADAVKTNIALDWGS